MARNQNIFALTVLAAIGITSSAAADGAECIAPNVMVTLDKSSSMITGSTPSGITKWAAAQMGVGELVTGFGDRINFGLQIFPYPNQCAPGEVVVAPGADTSDAIVSSLGSAPPSSGNWTPISQTLAALESETSLHDSTRDNRIVLITDGWQWCSPYSSSTRFDAVPVIERLRAQGILTHVIGFGDSVDPALLDRAAVAGGTARSGCTPVSTSTTTGAGNCYTQVDDIDELRDALEEIASNIGVEVCDGVDNDCDGDIDEGFDHDFDGVTSCAGDCNDNSSSVYPGASDGPTANCDTLDNDCDGMTDEGCSCTSGLRRACSAGVGVCASGEQTCSGGIWGSCTPTSSASTEICDGLDNDCDGTNDDGATCPTPTDSCVDGECVGNNDPDTDMDTVPDRIEQPRGDTDGDGTDDWLDPDDDNDTIPTRDERPENTDIDTDGDSKPNYLDPDDDNDTVLTRDERPGMMDVDTDSDGAPDHLDPDNDGDGIPTKDEDPQGGDGRGLDSDGDGHRNYNDPDDDNDSIPTRDERPDDQDQDTDNDGAPNHLDPDDDNDTIPTITEANAPEGFDFDNDQTPNHLDLDSDSDSFPDEQEGTNDDDGDGHPNYLDPADGFIGGVSGGAGCAVGGEQSGNAFGMLLGALGLAFALSRRQKR